jgi:D-glucosaminate-6-phosphate ammonia-lyase
MSIYEELGVRTIINAKGQSTRLSGGFLDAAVARAMVEASQHCVDIAELQSAASRVIAEITGAEAGYVTAGAATGLLLGAAACVTGLDPARLHEEVVVLGTSCLHEGDPPVIAARVRDVLGGRHVVTA